MVISSAHNDIDSMWNDALNLVLNRGNVLDSRIGRTIEVLGYQTRMRPNGHNFLLNKRRALSPVFAAAEFLWHLSRNDSTTMIKGYAPQYEKYSERDGTAHGAYGKRIATLVPNWDQLYAIVNLLQAQESTRQAIVGIWNPKLDLTAAVKASKKDIPCTLHWQFFIRRGALDMHVYFRSQDLWLGFPYDVFVCTSFQRLLAATLDRRVGEYVHTIGSMHLYDKNLNAAAEAVRGELEVSQAMPSTKTTLTEAMGAVFLESKLRNGTIKTFAQISAESDWLGLDEYMRDIVRLVSQPWLSQSWQPINSSFQRGLEQYVDHRGDRLSWQDNSG